MALKNSAVVALEAGTTPPTQFAGTDQLPLFGLFHVWAEANCTEAAKPAAAVRMPTAFFVLFELRMFLHSQKTELTPAPTRV